MFSSTSKSVAAPERERLVSPALLIVFALLVGVGLTMIFPRATLHERLLEKGNAVDSVTIAYLEAWTRIAPNDVEFLSVLAEHYAHSGRTIDAERLLVRIAALSGEKLEGRLLAVRISVAEQRAYEAAPESAERNARMAILRKLLRQAANTMPEWTLPELQSMAVRAVQIGDTETATKIYRELGMRDPGHAEAYNQKLFNLALGAGEYRDAAQVLLEENPAPTIR